MEVVRPFDAREDESPGLIEAKGGLGGLLKKRFSALSENGHLPVRPVLRPNSVCKRYALLVGEGIGKQVVLGGGPEARGELDVGEGAGEHRPGNPRPGVRPEGLDDLRVEVVVLRGAADVRRVLALKHVDFLLPVELNVHLPGLRHTLRVEAPFGLVVVLALLHVGTPGDPHVEHPLVPRVCRGGRAAVALIRRVVGDLQVVGVRGAGCKRNEPQTQLVGQFLSQFVAGEGRPCVVGAFPPLALERTAADKFQPVGRPAAPARTARPEHVNVRLLAVADVVDEREVASHV